jgi:hypothetical protein
MSGKGSGLSQLQTRTPPLRRPGLANALAIALGAAMLLWTAALDGRPTVFTDTALYYSQGAYLFEALGLVSPAATGLPAGDPTALPAVAGTPSVSAAIDGARSVLYGAPLYALQRLGGLWLVAGVQALAVAGVLYLLWRTAAPRAPRWGYLALMAGLALLSPLADFTSFAMPDVFAGVAGCATLLLLIWRDRLGLGALLAALALAAYGFAVHRSNLVVGVGVAGLALPLLRLGGLAWSRAAGRAALVVAAAAAAYLAGAIAEAPVQARAGEPIGSPPFLSARVIADGPGRSFLRRDCTGPHAPFELCAYRDRPMKTADQVLWSIHRASAVFLADPPAGRIAMERQDARFALDATLADPLDEAAAAARNAAEQFVEVHADDPRRPQGFYIHDAYWRATSLARLEPDPAACPTVKACRPRLGRTVSAALVVLGLSAAGAVVVAVAARRDVRAVLLDRLRPGPADDRVRLLQALALVVALLVLNAVVCGALSGPFARYQARVVWLFPASAALLVAGLPRRRPSRA